jgi:4-aminobutyrate aminotransferase-like enzyme/Ser/Thr protein kinase RdoA (MazF antagonist)
VLPVVDKAPRFSAEQAVQLAAELYGLDVTATSLPSERDQNFRLHAAAGAQYVLKIANLEESREILELQNASIRHLTSRAAELAWPRIVPTLAGEEIAHAAGHHVRLFTWINGACFAVQPHTPDLLNSLGRALAQIDNAFEGFFHPGAQRTFYWDLRQSALARPHLDLLPAPQRQIVEAFLDGCAAVEWDRLRHGVIHGDANDYNVLTDAAGTRVVSILDFGDMVHSATVCDLAVGIAYAMLDKQDPIATAAEVVRGYHAIRPLAEPEIDAIYPLAAARLAMSVCYSAWQASVSPHNDYLSISETPARALLDRLAALPRDWPREVFRRACGLGKYDRAALLDRRRAHLAPSLSISYARPLHVIRGSMQHLYDADGRQYLDCVNNVAHVGHCHPRVVAAAAGQSALLNTNTRYLHEHLVDYIERLTATLPARLSVAFLVSSGSEANELALRLARAHTGREGTIAVDTAYHGNTNALVDLSPYKFNGPGGRGKPRHVEVVPMPDVYRSVSYTGSVAEATRQLDGVAAFFCESALSCGGQIILPAGYLKEAYAAVRAAGGICVADEVQTGFGRAGSHFWMFETQGVEPDIVTMGKPIGNGHPLAAVVTTREIAASFANGMEYFNTFGGNPVSCAVGLAVLDVIRDEGLQENASDTGDYLLRGLRDLAQRRPLIGDVRGMGLFLGFEMVRNPETLEPAAEEAAELVNRMKDLGVLLSTDGPMHNVIKIKPPLVFSRGDADFLIDRLGQVLPQ